MAKKPPRTIYGRRLREARESYGFSQTDLGVAVGLDMSCASGRISRYETGVHQPKLGLQQRFADALELPLTFFYTEGDRKARRIANASRSDKPVQRLVEIKKITNKRK